MTLQSETTSARVAGRRARTHRGSETRRRVAAVAARLFTEGGYEGTSMQMIADAAGVHPQTVYLAFGTKAAVLAEAAALLAEAETDRGPESAPPSEPAQQLCRYVRRQNDVAARLGPLLALVAAAAYRDPDVAAFCDQYRRNGLGAAERVVAHLEANGALRRDVRTEDAVDIVYTMASPDSYMRMVGDRGWTPERYGQWLGDLLCDRLLVPATVPRKGRRGDEC